MNSPKHSMPERVQRLEEWRRVYHQAQQTFESLHDVVSLQVLREIDARIQQIKQENLLAEALDYQELERVSGDENFPYSILSWYEDEKKDIWEGLE